MNKVKTKCNINSLQFSDIHQYGVLQTVHSKPTFVQMLNQFEVFFSDNGLSKIISLC